MAVAKNSKKSTKAVEEVTVVESPTRVSRRSAPTKAVSKKASPSPSPAPKALKKKSKNYYNYSIFYFFILAATTKKSKKVESEDESKEESEEEKPVAKSVPLVSKSTSKPVSKDSCAKKMIRGYLIIYNTLSAFAWGFLLFNLAKSYFIDDAEDYEILFSKTGLYLAYLQTVALLEVMHAAFRWVRSGVMSNVIQIASRLFVIWVAGVFGGSGKHWAYAMMSVAWALSDFTRYAYYLTQLTEVSVPVLKWARYNFFLVLYPVGTLGEAILIFLARLKWSKDLVLSYGLLTVLAIYTPGI